MDYIQELRAFVGNMPLIMVGAGVLVFDAVYRLLLLRRSDNHLWGILGGAMEPGETLEETALREISEETGLEVRGMQLMDIYALLDGIQTIARNGLQFAASDYDMERYERLMDLAMQTYSELLDEQDKQIRARFLRELGYITPKVGADGAIFNAAGEILLMERADGSGWCLPCGFVEPNETPVEAVIREVREETGLEIEIGQLVGVFTRKPSAAYGPHTTVAIVHLCKVTGGELRLSHEGLDLRYWAIDAVPYWHANHERYALAAHQAWISREILPAISD